MLSSVRFGCSDEMKWDEMRLVMWTRRHTFVSTERVFAAAPLLAANERQSLAERRTTLFPLSRLRSTHHHTASISAPFTVGYGLDQKIGAVFCTPKFYQILTGFRNCFTVRIRRKFAIMPSPKIPPHLKCVATLPCEMPLSGANLQCFIDHAVGYWCRWVR